jgi:NAD(P)-dependent dehydrogenase (short-subunit alcohol dehydrogenase family)
MILESFKLDGKVALVTGASRGLGQGMALGLAEAGADIAGLDLTECNETRQQVEALGRRYHSVVCDLREATLEQLSGVVADVVSALGRLDILLNNAGIIRRAPIFEFSEAYWDDVLQINLKAVFFLSQSAARQKVAAKSSISPRCSPSRAVFWYPLTPRPKARWQASRRPWLTNWLAKISMSMRLPLATWQRITLPRYEPIPSVARLFWSVSLLGVGVTPRI